GTDWEVKRRYQTVEYEYYDNHIRKSTYTADNKRVRYERFDNPSGRNPVIPIRNKRGADEENGRPECEPFLPIFTRYTDVLDTALKGNLRQGRPTPTIKKMGTIQQVEAFWRMFGRTRKQMNPDTGQIEDITVIPFDPDVLMTLGGDAE